MLFCSDAIYFEYIFSFNHIRNAIKTNLCKHACEQMKTEV